MKRVLLIAYHFPPLAGSSGIQRTLRFVQHLPKFGWDPIVLTAHPRAYEKTSADLLADVPSNVVVRRAFALDTARHLSIGGRYLGFLARPDRWMTWQFDGIRQGLNLIQQHRPQAIWSTYPIATAHLIGHALARRTGLPWIADFRDPMAQKGYPADPRVWQSFKRIEEAAMHDAKLNLFTTPGAARMYRERYPFAANRIDVLENGYDEDTFVDAENAMSHQEPLNPGCLTLLHSGIVYPAERDPTELFNALGQLVASGQLDRNRLKVRFRAASHEDLLRQHAATNQIEDMIEIMPAIPYREALAEMLRADGLLVLQASNCNDQIPAKIYEYLRARRPIVALTDPKGDTASVVATAGICAIAPLDQSAAIASTLLRFVADPLDGTLPTPESIALASREGRTAKFSTLIEAITCDNNCQP
jgi:hypothetical protein